MMEDYKENNKRGNTSNNYYSRADKLIDCALFDKSTKIGTEVV